MTVEQHTHSVPKCFVKVHSLSMAFLSAKGRYLSNLSVTAGKQPPRQICSSYVHTFTEYEVALLINFNLVDTHARDFYCLATNSSCRLDS